MADLNVGSTYVRMDADTSDFERKFKAAGILAEQTTAKVDKAVKSAAGSRVGRTVEFGKNDGTGNAVVTGTIPGDPTKAAAAASETKSILDAMRAELFGPVKQSLDVLKQNQRTTSELSNTLRQSWNSLTGFKSGRGAPGEGDNVSILGGVGRLAGAAVAGAYVARQAFDIGQQLNEFIRQSGYTGKQQAAESQLFDRETDSRKRRETIQKELDETNAAIEVQSRFEEKAGGWGTVLQSYFFRDSAGPEKLRERSKALEAQLRNESGVVGAEERRMRRARQTAYGYDQIDEQYNGQYGMKELIQSMESTRQNTELLNFIAQRIPR